MIAVQKRKLCVYCGQRPGSTDDHVPPKCFFQKICPHGTQRITVPCCNVCRKLDEKNDGLIRNCIAGLLSTESSDYVQDHLLDKILRSIARASTESNGLIEVMHLQKTRVLTKSGLQNVLLPALNLDIPEMDRFFERIARALLYKVHNIKFFAGRVRWIPVTRIPDYVAKHFQQQGTHDSILNVFKYCVSPPFDSGTFLILVTFYQSQSFIVNIETLQP